MKRILIIKLGAIGDVIHSLPVLSTLRTCFPEAYIGWAVEEAAAPVLEGNPDLTELILLERRKLTGKSGLSFFRKWVREVRKKSFDVVLDLHNLLKSGIIAITTRAPVRIGFRKLREGNFIFMNQWVKPETKHRHAVEKYLSLLKPLGINETQWIYRFPLMWDALNEESIDAYWVQAGLDKAGPVVAINPGANWASKRWMPDRYAKVADQLVKQYGASILILWGAGERSLAETIAYTMSERAVIAQQSSLKQLMALIKRCQLMISGDSGPLHIAAALRIPTVALFGPSDPKRNGPYGEGHIIIESAVPPATHWQTKERGSRWMREISTERVLRAAIKKMM